MKEAMARHKPTKTSIKKRTEMTDPKGQINKLSLTSHTIEHSFYQGDISEKAALEELRILEDEIAKIKGGLQLFIAAGESGTDREPIQGVSWLDLFLYEITQLGFCVEFKRLKPPVVTWPVERKDQNILRIAINEATNRRIMSAFSWYIVKSDTRTSVLTDRNGRINQYRKAAIDRAALIAAFRDVFEQAKVKIPHLAERMQETDPIMTGRGGKVLTSHDRAQAHKKGDDGQPIMLGTQKPKEEEETYGTRKD